jgi:hypothetical protein
MKDLLAVAALFAAAAATFAASIVVATPAG